MLFLTFYSNFPAFPAYFEKAFGFFVMIFVSSRCNFNHKIGEAEVLL